MGTWVLEVKKKAKICQYLGHQIRVNTWMGSYESILFLHVWIAPDSLCERFSVIFNEWFNFNTALSSWPYFKGNADIIIFPSISMFGPIVQTLPIIILNLNIYKLFFFYFFILLKTIFRDDNKYPIKKNHA